MKNLLKRLLCVASAALIDGALLTYILYYVCGLISVIFDSSFYVFIFFVLSLAIGLILWPESYDIGMKNDAAVTKRNESLLEYAIWTIIGSVISGVMIVWTYRYIMITCFDCAFGIGFYIAVFCISSIFISFVIWTESNNMIN